MTSKLLYAAENWDTVYQAFQQVNFTAYDYESVKQSLLDYLKLTYPENFNDYIESSNLVALIETFAYVSEQLAYRVDMASHEGTLSTAQRKQMILRHAKFISYSASRNLPLRGLVKITSISVSEDLTDSQGNSLSNRVIRWADAASPLWREQFQLAIGRVLTRSAGAPLKVARVNDVVFQQHEARNLLEAEADGTSFTNGVIPYTVDVNGRSLGFELVPADIDNDGVFERSPSPTSYFSMLYADDGFGETSPLTGFMFFTKQGTLNRLNYVFDYKLPNRVIDIDIANVNDVDVWLQELTESGALLNEWEQVDNINGSNLFFNQVVGLKKYEVETLENDKIRMLFGDGDFADIPAGLFNIWVRASTGGDLTVPREAITNKTFTFAYVSAQGRRESCTVQVSLTSALQNGSAAEDIEHIRTAAPAVYSTQERMVNGQDYNSYPLKDSSILHLKTVNRTFAGQPKHVEWNDASGSYQNIKLFGDDGRLYYDISAKATTTKVSARSLIDEVLEPTLGDPGVYNLLTYAFFSAGAPLNKAYVRPRIKFAENAADGLFEKTLIQGVLDRHWYGEPDTLAYLGPDLTPNTTPKSYYAVVNDDADHRIYDQNKKMVLKGAGAYTLVDTPGNISGIQDAVMRQRRFGIKFNPDRPFVSKLVINNGNFVTLTPFDLLTATALSPAAVVESLTVEIINSAGEFTVAGTVTGLHAPGVINEVYDNGVISFIINFPVNAINTSIISGDAWIIDIIDNGGVLTPSIYKRNLQGAFTIISELLLPIGAELLAYDANDDVASWVMIVERNDDLNGHLDFWRVTSRNFQLILGSPTTKFYHDKDSYVVDQATKKRVRDNVKILKSNLSVTGTSLGTDQKFFTVDMIRHADGEINPFGLLISPDTINIEADSIERAASAYNFLSLIGNVDDRVYFYRDPATARLMMIEPTAYIAGLTYINGTSGNYVRMPGRSPLDFSWAHYVGGDNLVDPTPGNIHDMYVLTRGFYTAMNAYLKGLGAKPTPPTPFELRTTYRTVLQKKMMSDTVVLHPAKVKPLFGEKAVPELRAKLKLIKAAASRATDDQLRTKVLNLVNAYFNIEEWGFGKTFYAAELCAVIQKTLAVDLASVVIVPELPANSFGDLLEIHSSADEIIMSALELKDIMVITQINRTTIRQL
jgi:hypothetical protein